LYANPRNAASGSLKLLNPAESKKRGLEIVIYDLLNPPKNIHFQSEIAPYLKDFGLPVFLNKWTQKAYSAQEILSFAHLVENMRSALPFQIDGVVIKLDDLDLRSSMGSTHKSPRWAVAYKFSPEQAETVIEKISIQVGRTGVLTPVAHLKPVLLSGSTISRATLHNQDEIDRKDIREGDQVIIEKGGDVIPKIVSVVINPQKVRGKKWHFPTTCPYCGSALVHNEGQVAIRCGAKQNCSGQYIARIKHFVSKGAMNIETFGVKVVEQLYEAKLLQSLTDIYRLKASDLNDLEGFGQKSIHLLLTHIEKSKDCELYRFIFALGIPFVGVVAAKAISEKVKSIDQLLDVSYDDLIGIEGVGEKVAESILNYVQDKSNCEEIKTFMKLGISPREIVEKRKDHPFSGRQFVITGTLENYDRTEVKELIESLGGKVLSTLSKQTEYLLLGKNPGSKYKKALELNVKILTEEAFKGMV
jgi:DNA ligase (NAD+)